MRLVYRACLLAILLVLPRPSLAGAITITNVQDDESTFLTRVRGSVGFFSHTHQLVDIPNTPWVNSSTIVETNGSLGQADSLSITWTTHHIAGPHADDVNPNPNGPVTLSLSFTATAAGTFEYTFIKAGDPFTSSIVDHPNNELDADRPLLKIALVTVASTTFGGFDIQDYIIEYSNEHSRLVFPPIPPFPFPDEPLLFVSFGFDCEPQAEVCTSNVPEPATAVLLGLGGALLAFRRGRARGRLLPMPTVADLGVPGISCDSAPRWTSQA